MSKGTFASKTFRSRTFASGTWAGDGLSSTVIGGSKRMVFRITQTHSVEAKITTDKTILLHVCQTKLT